MTKLFGCVLGLYLTTSSCLIGQSLLDEVNFRTGTVAGIHLNGLTVFSGYNSSVYPGLSSSGSVQSLSGTQSLGSDINYGARLSLGWQYHRPRTDFSMLYSGSYGGFVRNTGLGGLSQSLTLHLGRQFTSKWLLNLSGSAQDSTQVEYLNQPSSLSVVSQLPLTFDDLAASFSISHFTNTQTATALFSSPQFESPARNLLVGTRLVTYSGQIGLTYAHSSRLSFQFTGFTAAGQFRTDSSMSPAQFGPLARSMGINAGVGMSYSLSPRTTFSLNAGETYIQNRYEAGYVSSATATLGRKMGQHWFLSGFAGATFSQMARQVYTPAPSKQWTGGGSLGYQGLQHTLIASYNRTAADAYGFSTGKNSTASGSWVWRRPASRWSVFANAGEQQINGNGYADLQGWTVSGGVSNRLTPQTVFTTEYSYSNDSGVLEGKFQDLTIHMIRLSLSWSPAPVYR